jgi:hypothetical protein
VRAGAGYAVTLAWFAAPGFLPTWGWTALGILVRDLACVVPTQVGELAHNDRRVPYPSSPRTWGEFGDTRRMTWHAGEWSLSNAFVRPIFAGNKDLLQLSADQMLKHWGELAGLYGTAGIQYAGVATYLPEIEATAVTREPAVPALLDRVISTIQAARN